MSVSRVPLSHRLLRAIAATPKGGRSYDGWDAMLYAVAIGKLLERGLVRERKHRDHTRDHALTSEGKAELARIGGAS